MKRLIAALGLTAVALSASAVDGAPFEQTELDRVLPNIEFASVAPYAADSNAPFEQVQLDRVLPNLPGYSVQYAQSAVAGSTRTDAIVNGETPAGSVWANDHNFIAPAQ